MKTKVCTLIAIFAMLILANKINGQAIFEITSIKLDNTQMALLNNTPLISNFITYNNCNDVQISWTVKCEPVNSVYFIERSVDEINFIIIGKFDSKYCVSKVNEYTFSDPNPSGKTAYYSIRQESISGTLYSKLLTVEKLLANIIN